MHKLRILQLCNVQLISCYENFPKKLRWLHWQGFPLKFLPNDFHLESLVVLDMRNSSLSQLWKGTKMLRLLKILNLSRSHGLVNSPDFLQLPNLEKLVLEDCINVVGVHESIGKLERLVFLNLRGCRNLTKLPREIVLLKSLEKLILSNFSRLEKLPPDLGKIESLKVLHADGINQLSSNTGAVKPWLEHAWSWVSKLGSRPESICFSLTSLPCSLVSLNLANCNISGDGIPGDLGTLSLLHTLNLSGNPICSVPGNLKGLTSLFTLTLDRCTRLKSLLELPMRFAGVSLTGCSSLEMVTNLPNLLQQLNLDILDCKKLVEVRGVFKLEPIANIDSEMINNLCLTELDSMGMVEVELCNNLTNSIIKAPTLQGLHECGIYSIFLSGSEIPSWFDKKNRNSSMSFTVPSLPHLKFCGLNICVVYACATNVSQAEWSYEYIKVSNKTKGLKWAYRPTFRGTAYEHKDVIWLSDWKIADLLMECGDEMNIFVNMAELFKVKEFGIRILYDEEEQKGIQNNTGYPFNQNVIDLSAYQMKKGEYFLCNLDDIGRGLHYSRMSEPKWECLENTGEMEVEEGG
ncbi:disease resistance protein TAO1-like [Camellia sinensis]|uniref:disease resistance protein TAO1-like n=1 Tax=Camellia sinensis TaxID=4442 RepID=UPI0010364CAB|nr:disease resistance protein TAO1-like [Camellia sinensis]